MFDLLIIGGGINGAAVAREAAARGLSVCLLEREDFGAGTTAASTRLIHGGLRYLRYGEVGLVRESLRERAILLSTAPHLVRPLTFLLPVYAGSPYGPAQLRAGLWLYDRLARDQSLPGSQQVSPDEWSRWEPHLAREGLRALLAYSDAQVDYPERLCLEYVLAARERGAEVKNHTEVTALLRDGPRVIGVAARDRITGEELDVRAQAVLNAAGPWVDHVNRLLTASGAERGAWSLEPGASLPPLIGAVKGSHLVLPWPGEGPRHAVYSAARRDGRPFFLIPWAGALLIGTTEVVEAGAPDAARCTPAEMEYLIEETNHLYPALALRPEQIAYTYAGLRPLPSATTAAAAVTRRHFVVDHAAHGVPGLLSIIGGKLTTARSLAITVVDLVERNGLGRKSVTRSPAHPLTRSSLPGGVPDFAAFRDQELQAAREQGLGLAVADHLASLYGARAPRVRALAVAEPGLAETLCPHSPVIGAQVRFAVEEEMARTLADVMLRRTPLGLVPGSGPSAGSGLAASLSPPACLGRDAALAVAHLMAPLLGWDDARRDAEVDAYESIVHNRLPAR